MMTRITLPGRAILLAVLTAAVAAMGGCSRSGRPALGTVSGTVMLDGHPLANAAVRFTPAGKGRTSQGVTDHAGRYRLAYLRDIAGANLGRHAVRITTATEENGGRETLPQRYHAATVLEATVSAGDNRCDFPLESQETR